MQPKSKRSTAQFLPNWTHLPLCLVLGAVLSLVDRTDANWDLQNYHLYGPFALLHGRLGRDFFAAAYQGYFNPLADVPYYVAKFVLLPHCPRLVALLAGLPYGALVYLVLQLSALLVPGRWTGFFAALLGLTGATTLSEVGTTYDDILFTDFLLLAMIVLIEQRRGSEALSGLLCGLGVAMKLTAGIFALPLAGMVVVLAVEQKLVRLVLFGLAVGMGFAIGYGWWGWQLWLHYANPFYPMFGGLFHSLWAVPVNPQDVRFFPKTLLQWLAYPFFWLQGRSYEVAELHVRDPRFAFIYLAALSGLWCLIRKRVPPRPVLALWLFMISAYIIWLFSFSILRYALPLEVLTGVFIATVMRLLCPERWLAGGVILLTVFCLAITKPMGWGRIGYGKALVMAPVPVLPPQALVLMAGHPIGFTLPYLARPDTRFVSLDELRVDSPEWQELLEILAAGSPAMLLTNARGSDPAIAVKLEDLQLRLQGQCMPIRSAVQDSIELCPLRPSS
jgi:hypothetical protein